MWFTALLCGFTLDDPTTQIGPDTWGLPTTPAAHRAWATRADTFRRDFGDWRVRWDERNGTPRALTGPAVPVERARELAERIAALGGVSASDLVPDRVKSDGVRTGLRYRQTWRGAPIENGFVDLVVERGVISYAVANLHHVELDGVPAPGERVLPRPAGARWSYRWVRVDDDGLDVTYRDRAGQVVHRWTRRMPLDVTYPLREPTGPLVVGPVRRSTVSDGVTVELTDDLGGTSLTGPLDVKLDGPEMNVFRAGVQVGALDVADGMLDPGVDLDLSSAAVLPNFFGVRDWLLGVDPTHPWLAEDVGVFVDESGTCNAFYVGGTISFFDEGGGCGDTAQMSDVVYHESGHGIHDYGLLAGTFASDVSEGSSDFVSATINDDPLLALGFFGPGTFLRELDTNKVWPQDQDGDPHITGLIWGGFWWDVRTALVAELGPEIGVATTDRLFVDTLKYGPSITDFEAVLAADDDDGDPTNGTPHGCTLLTQGALHGLAPSPLGLLTVTPSLTQLPSGTPLDPPAAVPFTLAGSGVECGDLDEDGVRLWWAADPTPGAAAGDTVFTEGVPTHAGSDYTAEIPAQPAGTRVVYYVTWGDPTGAEVYRSHPADTPVDRLFQYWVGDQADLWCDDFEGGQGGWTTGGGALDGQGEVGESEFQWGPPPGERAFGATSAASGANVLGQRLDDGLPYRPDNEQHAESPEISLADANHSLLVLAYRRWLSVDAAELDRAAIRVDGVGPVWQNDRGVATLDGGWTEQVVDLTALLSAARPSTTVAFTLSTDGSVAYDGWSVDDVCVRTLAEPERHYTDVGLVASDDADTVTVSWTQPWVRPIWQTRLVRKRNALPTTEVDGDLVAQDLAPVPGQPVSVEDADVEPGAV
ncbi:MAG: hypothetical protein ABMA64_15970, partial [Myxococcota bacterium]